MISIQKYSSMKEEKPTAQSNHQNEEVADCSGFPTPADAVVNSVEDFKKLLEPFP